MTGAVLPSPAAGGAVLDNRAWVYQNGWKKVAESPGVAGGAAWILSCPACLKALTGGTTGAKRHMEGSALGCKPNDLAGKERKKMLVSGWKEEQGRVKRLKGATVTSQGHLAGFMALQANEMGKNEPLTVVIRSVLMFFLMNNISINCVESDYLTTMIQAADAHVCPVLQVRPRHRQQQLGGHGWQAQSTALGGRTGQAAVG